MLLTLFYVAADAGELLQTRHIKLVVVMHLDAHARHAVFETLNILFPTNPLQDIAGERCCFVHTRLCVSFLVPPVRSHDARRVGLSPPPHPARLRSSEWPV